jgi:translation initiation factor IF-3
MKPNTNRDRNVRVIKTNKHKLNNEVRFPQVRLVGFYDDPILMSSYEASKLAEENELDLILINENQDPPIVRIEDYKKFLYDTEKAEKEKKKNSVKSITKEIQLSPEISENDLNTKIKKGLEFLEDGNKIKVVLQLKGRQKATPQRGELTMLKFAKSIDENGTLESLPKLEGGRWFMMVKPISKK